MSGNSGHEIRVPPLGPDQRVLLARWLVPDGAHIAANDGICELETEQATADLPSVGGGTLKQAVAAPSVLAPGQVIGWVTPLSAT
jgi:pyruvate/2-oxoglutarate dehydrogenase complex dihydrolipoamide acyltransferase (E2) component